MLITLTIVLLVVGAALYVLQLAPFDPTIKRIIQVIVIVAVVIYVLREFAGPLLGDL